MRTTLFFCCIVLLETLGFGQRIGATGEAQSGAANATSGKQVVDDAVIAYQVDDKFVGTKKDRIVNQVNNHRCNGINAFLEESQSNENRLNGRFRRGKKKLARKAKRRFRRRFKKLARKAKRMFRRGKKKRARKARRTLRRLRRKFKRLMKHGYTKYKKAENRKRRFRNFEAADCACQKLYQDYKSDGCETELSNVTECSEDHGLNTRQRLVCSRQVYVYLDRFNVVLSYLVG